MAPAESRGASLSPEHPLYRLRRHRGALRGRVQPWDGPRDVNGRRRAGFKTVLEDRLTSVDVRLLTETNPLIRRYAFTYRTGPFNKTLLTRDHEFGEDGVTEFNHHGFEYFDEVSGESAGVLNGFGETVSFWRGDDRLGDRVVFDKTSAAFSADQGGARSSTSMAGLRSATRKRSPED